MFRRSSRQRRPPEEQGADAVGGGGGGTGEAGSGNGRIFLTPFRKLSRRPTTESATPLAPAPTSPAGVANNAAAPPPVPPPPLLGVSLMVTVLVIEGEESTHRFQNFRGNDPTARSLSDVDPYMTFPEFRSYLSIMLFEGLLEPHNLQVCRIDGETIAMEDNDVISKWIQNGDFLVVRNLARWRSSRMDLAGARQESATATNHLLSGDYAGKRQEQTNSPWQHKNGPATVRSTLSLRDASLGDAGTSACTSVCLVAAKYLLVIHPHAAPSSLAPSDLDEFMRIGVELVPYCSSSAAENYVDLDEVWHLPRYARVRRSLKRLPNQVTATSTSSLEGPDMTSWFESILERCLRLCIYSEQGNSSSRMAILVSQPPQCVLIVYDVKYLWFLFDSLYEEEEGQAGGESDDSRVAGLVPFDSMATLALALEAKFPTVSTTHLLANDTDDGTPNRRLLTIQVIPFLARSKNDVQEESDEEKDNDDQTDVAVQAMRDNDAAATDEFFASHAQKAESPQDDPSHQQVTVSSFSSTMTTTTILSTAAVASSGTSEFPPAVKTHNETPRGTPSNPNDNTESAPTEKPPPPTSTTKVPNNPSASPSYNHSNNDTVHDTDTDSIYNSTADTDSKYNSTADTDSNHNSTTDTAAAVVTDSEPKKPLHPPPSTADPKSPPSATVTTTNTVKAAPSPPPSQNNAKSAMVSLSSIMDMTMFVDPVFGQVMADPVVCSDGKTYDRPVITQHFENRIQAEEERLQRLEEQDSATNDSSACAGPRPPIKLTSPITNQEVDGDLTPNEMVERLIVQLMATNAFGLQQEEIDDWNRRREEKKLRDEQRQDLERRQREEDERMRRAAEVAKAAREAEAQAKDNQDDNDSKVDDNSESSGSDKKAKPCDVIQLLRRVDQGEKERLSEDDIGIGVALCDRFAERVPLEYAEAVTGGQIRCMVGCCARRLQTTVSVDDGDAESFPQWCARCGRVVCRSCLGFQVSSLSNTNDKGSLHRVCGECLMHLVDLLLPQGAAGQLRAFLVRVRLAQYTNERSQRLIAMQDRMAQRAAKLEVAEEFRELSAQIAHLQQENEAAQAMQKVEEWEVEVDDVCTQLQNMPPQGGVLDKSSRVAVIAHLDGCEELADRIATLEEAMEMERRRLEATDARNADAKMNVDERRHVAKLKTMERSLEAAKTALEEAKRQTANEKEAKVDTPRSSRAVKDFLQHFTKEMSASSSSASSSRWLSTKRWASREVRTEKRKWTDQAAHLSGVETKYCANRGGGGVRGSTNDKERLECLSRLQGGFEALSPQVLQLSSETQNLYRRAMAEIAARHSDHSNPGDETEIDTQQLVAEYMKLKSGGGEKQKDQVGETNAETQALRQEVANLMTTMQALEGEDFNAALSRLSEMEATLRVLEETANTGNTRNATTTIMNSDGLDRTKDDNENAEDDDVSIDGDFLQALGKWDDLRPLPLGLIYPTERMSAEVDLQKKILAQHLPQSERKHAEEWNKKLQELTSQRDELEDDLDRQRRQVAGQEEEEDDSSSKEEKKKQARLAQRAQQDQKRRERELLWLEAERRARENVEEALRRKHRADEHATRRAFAAATSAEIFGGRGDLRMCRQCKSGPVENKACSDLGAHNDTYKLTYTKTNQVVYRKPNACLNCGWYSNDWNDWPRWDHVFGPH